jgi:hypothetical protein
MRWFILMTTIGFSFIFLACAQRQNAQGEQSYVEETQQDETDSYTWDFGEVPRGEIVSHDFIFGNETQEVLNIKEVTTSCGCMASEVRQKTLLPDEETVVEATFDSKGYTGQVRQFIYVHTDSLDRPIVKFVIKADVVAP